MSELFEYVDNTKNYKIKSPEGMVDFSGVRKIIKPEYLRLKFSNGETLSCSLDHPISTISGIVVASNLSKKEEVQTEDGSGCFLVSRRHIKKPITLYDIVDVGDTHLFYANKIVHHNCEFLGSGMTLISGKKLGMIPYMEPIEENDQGFRMYVYPDRSHNYVCVVDTGHGEGLDYSAFIIFDVSTVPFEVVCTFRNNEISPIIYPKFIMEAAILYNNCWVLVETNDLGQQVVDILREEMEYEGLLSTANRTRTQEISAGFAVSTKFGVRTTKQVKRMGCSTFKSIIESDQLVINDFNLLQEMNKFSYKNGSYEAAKGNDDLTMCLHRFNIVETEDGPKTIKWIVDNKYSGKVLSLDENNKFVWNKVIGHMSRFNNGKIWVSVKTNKGINRKTLICTSDHKCAAIKDIMKPEIEYFRADELKGKYSVRLPNITNTSFRNISPLYNAQQMSVILGIAIGDGHINTKGTLTTGHCNEQIEYNKYSQNILGGSLYIGKDKRVENKIYNTLQLSRTSQIHHLRNLMYEDNKKTIKNILNYITKETLAFWYMDDGHLTNYEKKFGNPAALLCTDSFSHEDHLLLQKLFKEKFDLDTTIQRATDKHFRLKISTKSSVKFFEMVAPYICKSMEYKLPKEYRDLEKVQIDNTPLEYSTEEVLDIVIHPSNDQWNSKLYDITVENNHNFVANKTVVHNCCVLFSWLTSQPYFRDISDTNIHSRVYQSSNIDDYTIAPFGVISTGNEKTTYNDGTDLWEEL
jgi:hypothetical protein